MQALARFLRERIESISCSWPLRYFGIACSACLIYTYGFWIENPWLLERIQHSSAYSVCWPFFPVCNELKSLTSGKIEFLLFLMVVLASISIILFCIRRFVATALILTSVAHLIKFLIILHDFQMMGNYHFMEFILFLTFLFCQNTASAIRFCLVALYFSAGTLKLNTEWISGNALPDSWHGPSSITGWLKANGFIYIATIYAILLELILVFGLLSRKRKIFLATVIQLFLFHLYSIEVVGAYYPQVMLSLIFYLFLDDYFQNKFNENRLGPKGHWNSLPTWYKACLVVFLCFQMVPKLFPGDLALTKHASIFRLTMLDATNTCKATARIKGPKSEKPFVINRFQVSRFLRTQCHPYNYFSLGKNICRFHQNHAIEIEMKLESKKSTDAAFTTVFSSENICSDEVGYNWFYNSWFLPGD